MSSFPLYLMRHGETPLTSKLVGHLDCDVLPEGVAACREQASDLRIEHLVTSDLKRCRSCAEAIGTPQIDPRWRELDFGDWDGLSTSEIDRDAFSRFWEDPDQNAPPGGERWSDLVARVSEAIKDIPSKPTLVVTHGGAMRAALHALCGFTMAQTWSFDLRCSSVLGLNVWEGTPRSAQITGLWP